MKKAMIVIGIILLMAMIPATSFASSTFTVSISERGLPSGTTWTGYVVNEATGGNNTIDTTSTVVTFSLGNGTYEYGFNSLKGYYPLNPNGYFTVSNGSYSLVGDIFSLMPLWMFMVELFGMFASLFIPAKLSSESGEWWH